MSRRALVLRHHEEDSPGLVGEAFAARGFDLDVVLMNEHSATPTVDGYDAVIVLGSTHAVYDGQIESTWLARELMVMSDAEDRDVPILGICFGAQALCRYHGGEVSPSVEPEIGWYEVELVDGAPISPGPWFEFHFDRCTLPVGAELWARTERAVQAFAVGANVGVQFHPEVDEHQLADWFSSGDDAVRDLGVDPQELLARTARETPAARQRAAGLVDVFLERARHHREARP
jgi:GMP synthase-like glutamine amidotransferase